MTASYPGSIKTWNNVTDDIDDVAAAHINDAYAEIIAIENDLNDVVKPGLKKIDNLQGVSVNSELTLTDGYVLTYDASTGKLCLKAKPTGLINLSSATCGEFIGTRMTTNPVDSGITSTV